MARIDRKSETLSFPPECQNRSPLGKLARKSRHHQKSLLSSTTVPIPRPRQRQRITRYSLRHHLRPIKEPQGKRGLNECEEIPGVHHQHVLHTTRLIYRHYDLGIMNRISLLSVTPFGMDFIKTSLIVMIGYL